MKRSNQQQDPPVEFTDKTFARLLGFEIRAVREAKGWTRLQLVGMLPSGIGDRTLLTYEHGIRHMTAVRLVEVCRALEIPASEMMHRALKKADGLRSYSFKVNLAAMIEDRQPGFEHVRRWAAVRHREISESELVLAPATVREMAAVLGMAHGQLATYLVEFASAVSPEVA